MARIAIYPGTFDPVTKGHIDIMKRAEPLFDRLVVAVNGNENPAKPCLFTTGERVSMIQNVLGTNSKIEVEGFRGLLVHYAQGKRAQFIIRGLRAFSDFEYEFQIYLVNKKLHPQLEMIYFMTNQQYSHISSSIIKEVAKLGGSTASFVPPLVEQKLLHKFGY